jgi:hypothetical protein
MKSVRFIRGHTCVYDYRGGGSYFVIFFIVKLATAGDRRRGGGRGAILFVICQNEILSVNSLFPQAEYCKHWS